MRSQEQLILTKYCVRPGLDVSSAWQDSEHRPRSVSEGDRQQSGTAEKETEDESHLLQEWTQEAEYISPRRQQGATGREMGFMAQV